MAYRTALMRSVAPDRWVLIIIFFIILNMSSVALTPERSQAVIVGARLGKLIERARTCRICVSEASVLDRTADGRLYNLSTSDYDLDRARRAFQYAKQPIAIRNGKNSTNACMTQNNICFEIRKELGESRDFEQ